MLKDVYINRLKKDRDAKTELQKILKKSSDSIRRYIRHNSNDLCNYAVLSYLSKRYDVEPTDLIKEEEAL